MVERRKFFAGIASACRASLGPDLATFHNSGTFNLMKLWYGEQRIHYEVVLDQNINCIEIGLHFEDGPASTIAYLNLLDHHILELKETLGHQTELERWTLSWGRIYELHPLEPLTPAVTAQCAKRLTLYISTLQPLIATANIPLIHS
ncbi:MAG TPA: hypothetical protein PK819_02130 [Thermomicrobiales bacterium]|nr:hypothetical protein [Thermomicrobiales bacterium]